MFSKKLTCVPLVLDHPILTSVNNIFFLACILACRHSRVLAVHGLSSSPWSLNPSLHVRPSPLPVHCAWTPPSLTFSIAVKRLNQHLHITRQQICCTYNLCFMISLNTLIQSSNHLLTIHLSHIHIGTYLPCVFTKP